MLQPSYDYLAREENGVLHLLVKGRSAGRMGMGMLLGLPVAGLLFVGLLATALGGGDAGGGILVGALLLGLLALALGNSKKNSEIFVSAAALKARGQTYDLEHVTAIQLQSPGDGVIATGALAAVAVAGQQLNQNLVITYGTRRIKILDGQTPATINAVTSIILGFLHKHGRSYGNASGDHVAAYEAAVAYGSQMSEVRVKEQFGPLLSPRARKIIVAVCVLVFVVLPGSLIATAKFSRWKNGQSVLSTFSEIATKNRQLDNLYFTTKYDQQVFDYPSHTLDSDYYLPAKSCIKSTRSDGSQWVEAKLNPGSKDALYYIPMSALERPKGVTCIELTFSLYPMKR